MKINLAKSAGFCFGVKRAIDIALKAAKEERNVYMLGDIVHNENVVEQIHKAGIKKSCRLSGGKNKTFLIRAHGIDKETLDKTSRLGYKVIDATCPMVKEIHNIARKMEKDGYFVIVIGDKKHDEVHGIVGQLKNKAIVIDNPDKIPVEKIKKIKKASIVVQSTQRLENVLKIVSVIEKFIPQVRFFNTICKPTRTKQEEIRTMPLKNDVMIIIGSKNSANTKRLYEISKSLNKNTYWVNSWQDIKPGWFKTARTAGVTSGASTPGSTTEEIINQIKQITSRKA